MRVINGHIKPISPAEQRQRNGLLAQVHIAKKDLGLNEGEYESILRGYKVESAGKLAIPQLERMVKYMKHLGWKPLKHRKKNRPADDPERLEALRKRVLEEAKVLPNWETRLPGLVESVAGVNALNWVRDAAKLERLLVIIGNLARMDRMQRIKEV